MVVDEIEMMVLPPTEEVVPAPVEEMPVEALEGESVAPPSLDPVPPAASSSAPPEQISQEAPREETDAQRARSGLVRRFREMPKTVRSMLPPAAATDVRQVEYEASSSIVGAPATSPGNIDAHAVAANADGGLVANSTVQIVELPPIEDEPRGASAPLPARGGSDGVIVPTQDDSEDAQPRRWGWEFVR